MGFERFTNGRLSGLPKLSRSASSPVRFRGPIRFAARCITQIMDDLSKFESDLWEAADNLRTNSKLTSSIGQSRFACRHRRRRLEPQVGPIPQEARFRRYIISRSQTKRTVDSRIVISRFIYYFFRMPTTVQSVVSHAATSAAPHINSAGLKPRPAFRVCATFNSGFAGGDLARWRGGTGPSASFLGRSSIAADTLPPSGLASGPVALPPKSEVIFAQTLTDADADTLAESVCDFVWRQSRQELLMAA